MSAAVFWLDRKELAGLKGLTERSRAAKAGHAFLLNKYYLDHLYEGTIVAGIKGPIARASYWVNQHVIDGVVNGAGRELDRARSSRLPLRRPGRGRRCGQRHRERDRPGRWPA